MRPQGTPLGLLMPCRPQSHSRPVTLGEQSLRMQMLSCEAQGQTWAVAWADVQDPRQVGEGLGRLVQALQTNVSAAALEASAFAPAGATPNPHSRRVGLRGNAPDGRQLWAETAVFSHATLLFQVTVIAPHPVQSSQVLFDSLKLGS